MFWIAGCLLLRAKGSPVAFYILQFLVIKTPDPDPELDPDPNRRKMLINSTEFTARR
jgi:hypothetical protein